MNKNLHNTSNKKSYFLIACIVASICLSVYVISNKAGEYLKSIEQQSIKLQPYQDLYKALIGDDKKQNTLLVLANNAELRTGGGFIGTVGIIESEKGKVNTNALVGVYGIDSSNGCEDKKYSQPGYLQALAPCPSLRDSNNYLDFSSNAKQALYFYQLNTNVSVDNVVQITPRVLERLLEKTGPIYLKDYDLTINKDNFRDTVQLEVESGNDKKQKKDPKSGVLGSLANQMISKLLSQDIYQLKDYLPLLQELIDQKHINLYSKNNKTQELINKIKADGKVKSTDDNFFMLTEANFAANKSSSVINNQIDMHQIIDKDGSSIIEMKIISSHSSDYKIPYVDPNTNQSTWLIGDNKSHINLVLPRNSIIQAMSLNKDRYIVSENNNHTTVEYDRYLKPLTQSVVSLSYKIPTKYVFNDQLIINSVVQKQLGGWPYQLNYSLTLPDTGYQLVAANVDSLQKETNQTGTIYYSGIIDSDSLLSFIYKK